MLLKLRIGYQEDAKVLKATRADIKLLNKKVTISLKNGDHHPVLRSLELGRQGLGRPLQDERKTAAREGVPSAHP